MPNTQLAGEATQTLETALLHEKRVVTYKWLSRQLKVDVNAAKRLLSEFYQQCKAGSLHATFCVQGEVNVVEGYRCELASQENLEDVQMTYRTFTVHIYSLQSSKLKDVGLLVAIDLDVTKRDTPDTMSTCRLILNETVECHETKRPAVHNNAAASSAQRPTDRDKPVDLSRSSSADGKTGLFQKGSTKPVPVKGKGSFFDGYANKPPRKSVSEPKIPAPPKPKIIPKSASMSASAAAQKKLRDEQQAALTKLMESDEDENTDGENDQIPRQLSEESAGAVSREPEGEETEAAPAVANELAEPENEVAAADRDTDTNNLPTRRVRKRRRVRKTRHITVGKYMKTEDYSDWEEYSEDEADVPAPEPKRLKQDTVAHEPETVSSSPPSKRGGQTAANKKAAGQKTLLSFFGKK
ncbi:DNA polymerase delta subunit 3 [Geranomyces variabilis]|nr:DNA polymerase delta subunit 3 [Geranomyces variabilis]